MPFSERGKEVLKIMIGFMLGLTYGIVISSLTWYNEIERTIPDWRNNLEAKMSKAYKPHTFISKNEGR